MTFYQIKIFRKFISLFSTNFPSKEFCTDHKSLINYLSSLKVDFTPGTDPTPGHCGAFIMPLRSYKTSDQYPLKNDIRFEAIGDDFSSNVLR
jgi:hypothetical protein